MNCYQPTSKKNDTQGTNMRLNIIERQIKYAELRKVKHHANICDACCMETMCGLTPIEKTSTSKHCEICNNSEKVQLSRVMLFAEDKGRENYIESMRDDILNTRKH